MSGGLLEVCLGKLEKACSIAQINLPVSINVKRYKSI